MRFLFTTLPLVGHFHPLLPFARGLHAAGHAVAFAAPASFAPVVGGAGFEHVVAGLDRSMDDLFPQLRTWTGPERVAFVYRELFAGLYPQHLTPDLIAVAATWRPDLIVREEGEYGGCLAADYLGLPHAAVDIHLAGDPPAVREQIAAPLNRHRTAYGLPADPDLAMLRRYLTLRPFPPSFHDPTHPPAPTTVHLRSLPEDRSGPEGLPGWVAALPDRPVVYVGLGTVFNKPEVFRMILAGLRDEAVTLIVTVGRNQDPADYGPQPRNVRIERYIPLSLVLPYCDLVVTNGGSGTLLAALAQGLPVVVVPITADQPENAARCRALGVGWVVDAAALTPERIRQAVTSVLGERTYRQNAQHIRDEIAAMPGIEEGVALLERLARERQPLRVA